MDKKGRDTAPFMIERRIRMSGQILFTDLDDTLLNDRKEVTPGSRRAIEAALARCCSDIRVLVQLLLCFVDCSSVQHEALASYYIRSLEELMWRPEYRS